MLEPVLPKNRRVFDRLRKYQVYAACVGFAGFVVIGILILLTRSGEWVKWAVSLLLGAYMVILGVLEVQRTLVFRRDLHEVRDLENRDC